MARIAHCSDRPQLFTVSNRFDKQKTCQNFEGKADFVEK